MLLFFVLHLLQMFEKTLSACPETCYCDDKFEYVSCVGDGLEHFPEKIPETSIRLEIRNFRTKKLFSGEFENFVGLQELKIQKSELEDIENQTFSVTLEKLDLSQNSLKVIGSDFFRGLNRLKQLDASSNGVESLEPGAFEALVALEQLNLRDNKLSKLFPNTFQGLHKLQYLNLDSNNISAMEVGTFQYLTSLGHLILSNNPLSVTRLDFFGSSRLQYVDISNVGLDAVPQSATRFVRDLRLAKNRLTRISAGDFDSYPYLGLLVLDDNKIEEIEDDALGRQEYLVKLWINGNDLKEVPSGLPPSLRNLYLEENTLTRLPVNAFQGLKLLEQLFLQRNRIQTVEPGAFRGLWSLRSLDLQANMIGELREGAFGNLSKLEILDLSQNEIKLIDSRAFSGLPHLSTLQLSRLPSDSIQLEDWSVFDRLHSLTNLEVYDSPTLASLIANSTRILNALRSIQELNIMHNRIQRLRIDFPSFFPNLRVVKLSGNSWHCTREDIEWLVDWLRQSDIRFYNSYDIRCASPARVQFKPVMMLTESDFDDIDEAFSSTENSTSSAKYDVINETSSITAPIPTSSTTVSSEAPQTTQKQLEVSQEHISIITEDSTSNPQSQSTQTELPQSSSMLPLVAASTRPKYLFEAKSVSVRFRTVPNSKLALQDPPQNVLRQQHDTTTEAETTVSHKLMSPGGSMSAKPQRRVLESGESKPQHREGWDVVAGLLMIGSGVLLLVIGGFLLCQKVLNQRQCNMRRRRSISYHPQRDEVSIESTNPALDVHHSAVNKLYVIRNSTDSQLQELLQETPEGRHTY